MSLPDACADLLLPDLDTDTDTDSEGGGSRERETEEQWEQGSAGEGGAAPDERWRWPLDHPAMDCCRSELANNRSLSGTAGGRCASAGSLLHLPNDNSRTGTCRRELPSRSTEATQHRAAQWGPAARLSAAVPDVAMAPNANTHLLTARDYFRLAPWEYSGGGVLQLDLGDGATHTPRPGSRAQRAGGSGASGSRQPREQHTQAMSCLRSRADDDELRAAIELSVIRAYSSFGSRASAAATANGSANMSANVPASSAAHNSASHNNVLNNALAWRGNATLPQSRSPNDLQLAATHMPTARAGRSSAPPPPVGGQRLPDLHTPPPHLALSRVGSVGSGERGGGSSRSPSSSPGASPRRPHDYLYRRHQPHHDYRLEAQYAPGSGPASRGHSPNTYA